MTSALSGLRVVDASTDLAGAYCAKLLTDLGATVVAVEPPGGAPLRRWSATGSVGSDGEADGAFFRYLRAGQRSVVTEGDDLDQLVAGADVVLGVSPERVRAANPSAVAVTFDAFGEGSPRSGERMDDFLLQALSGSLSARGDENGRPTYVNEGGGQVGGYISGTFAAASALAALNGRHASGEGEAIEVSHLEGQALTLINYPTVLASFPEQKAETVRWLSIPGVEPCADGYVGFFVVTGQQWLDFLTLIERPDLGEDEELMTMPGRMARKEELLPIIRSWTSTRTAAEITELAALFRIPSAFIGRGDTMPTFDHLVERQSFATNPRGGFVQPSSPFRMSDSDRVPVGASPDVDQHHDDAPWPTGQPASRPAAGGADGPEVAGGRPLAGLRVLDLTTFWAGPIATQLLASLGADVIRIESVQRPDPQRFNTRVPRTRPQWYETSPFFVAPNIEKRCVTLNLMVPEGQAVFEQLAATADLVVENYTPRVLDNFGLSYDRLAAVNPRIILVRMPAFGLDGPWRDRPGFAQTVSQAGGMCWTTGSTDGAPMNPGAVCDPMSGIHAMVAALAAVEQRHRTGRGQLVEVPMIEVVLNMTAEQTVEQSAYDQLLARQGNRGPSGAPQGVYRCAGDDVWVALQVTDDEEWQALVQALGRPAWATDPSLGGVEGRRTAHDRIDAELNGWFEGRDADDAVTTLRAAGVGAEVVRPAHTVDQTDLFAARGFFEKVDHPIVGPRLYPAWPFRLASRTEPWFTRPAPLLGQHNEEVLREVGLDDDAITELADGQVIGTVPLGL